MRGQNPAHSHKSERLARRYPLRLREMNEDDYHHGLDDELYCDNCFYDFYEYCGYCGTVCNRDDTYWSDDGAVCEHCADNHYHTCAECEELVASRWSVEIKGNYYHEGCQP